jgi:hypothetical protein
MPAANEEDVVELFRQAVQDELQKLQSGHVQKAPNIFDGNPSLEEALQRLAKRHEELEHEVALLRTIMLRLVSEPVDRSLED